MNLNTDFVVDVIDWNQVFEQAMDRARIKWCEIDSCEPAEDDVISELIANNQIL